MAVSSTSLPTLSLVTATDTIASNFGQLGIPTVTTIFTPPSSCFATLVSSGEEGHSSLSYAPTDPGLSYLTDCYPDASGYPGASLTFSPGVCPSGYVPVSGTVHPPPSSGIVVLNAITVCPSGFYLNANTCYSAFPSSSVSNESRLWISSRSSSFSNGSTVYSTSTGTITPSGQFVTAAALTMFYENTHSNVVSLWSEVLASYSVSAPLNTTSSSSTPPRKAKHGLSGGAIAGIVIAAPAVLLFICGTTLFWLRRKIKTRRGLGKTDNTEPSGNVELDGKTIAPVEASSAQEIQELDSNTVSAELPEH